MIKKIFYLVFISLTAGYSQTQIGSTINSSELSDRLGEFVAISGNGNVIAVSAPYNNISGSNSGIVKVYQNNSGTWTQLGSAIPGTAIDDLFGEYLSLSEDGTVLAVGSIYNSDASSNAGQTRVFKFSNGNWNQLGNSINGLATFDREGFSPVLSEDGLTLATASYYADNNGAESGMVRIFQYQSGTNSWIQKGNSINGLVADESIGRSLSISDNGTILAIGTVNNDDGGTNAGQVRVYEFQSGTNSWVQIGSKINGLTANDQIGAATSLSADGLTLAVGGRFYDANGIFNSGHVRIFKFISGSWVLQANLLGTTMNYQFGNSVSLSDNGNVIAIGELYNGTNGVNSGRYYIYENNLGTWTQRGFINGTNPQDLFGKCVALSADGTKVVVGAPNNTGFSTINLGYVKVYDLTAILKSDSFVQANFSVYPNPSTNFITISLENNLTLEKVSIYNSLGQIVKNSNTNLVDISELAIGSYYLEVQTSQGKATKTIIKN